MVILSLTDHHAMYAVLESATEALSGRVLVNLSSDMPDTSLPSAVPEIFRRGTAAGHVDDSATSLIEVLKEPAV
ncbi:hypothetical protein ACFVT5_42335 [Streptomyces sp. NPDC058001]|uniref:hypothetical protein n=1 Tax=Streptomyces sp. NPDC058001 TaxID=3346300 RepID=UPI0036E58E64